MYLPLAVSLLSLVLAVSINILLFLLVRQSHPKTDLSKVFSFYSLSSSLWLIFIFLSITTNIHDYNLLFARLSIFFAVPLSLSLFLFAKILPKDELKMSRSYLLVFFLLAIILMILTLTPCVFEDVSLTTQNIKCITGWGIIPFGAYNTIFIFWAAFILFKKFLNSQGLERRRILLVLVGMAMLVCLITFAIFTPIVFLNTALGVQFAPIYVLIFTSLLSVAIIHYKLFDTKLITLQILAGLFLITVIAEIFITRLFNEFYFQLFFVGLTLTLGVILAKYINREIRLREQADNLASSLQNTNSLLEELDQQRNEILSLASEQLKISQSLVNTNQQKRLKEMVDNNIRLINLTESFRDIANFEKGKVELNMTSVNINELVAGTVAATKDSLVEKKLTIELEKSNLAGEVSVDNEQIKLVLEKLLDNAIKYSPPNSMIKVFVRTDDEGVSVWIKDDGFGFGRGEWSDLYGKFFRSRQATAVHPQGTGLSLYLCRKIIEAHGGRVWAHSMVLKKGAEFGFAIPCTIK